MEAAAAPVPVAQAVEVRESVFDFRVNTLDLKARLEVTADSRSGEKQLISAYLKKQQPFASNYYFETIPYGPFAPPVRRLAKLPDLTLPLDQRFQVSTAPLGEHCYVYGLTRDCQVILHKQDYELYQRLF